jgi:hypothetical protein
MELRVSGYDRQSHVFKLPQTGETWEAVCMHTAPADHLAKTADELPSCPRCLVDVGHHVAARQERQRPAIAAGLAEQLAEFRGDQNFA